MKVLYLILAIIGFILPYYFFFSFLLANGLDLGLATEQLFASDISTFFAVDLILTAIVFWVFLHQEAQHYHMGERWIYILTTLIVGPSFAFPLFLYPRVAHRGADACAKRSKLDKIREI